MISRSKDRPVNLVYNNKWTNMKVNVSNLIQLVQILMSHPNASDIYTVHTLVWCKLPKLWDGEPVKSYML